MLGLGAGISTIGRDAKRQAVKLGLAGDVLEGLALVAARDEARYSGRRRRRGLSISGWAMQPGFAFVQDVQEQRLGILAGAVRMRPTGQARQCLRRARLRRVDKAQAA